MKSSQITPISSVEFAANPEPRCPIVLILDTSTSMRGAPIYALNQGIQSFLREVRSDVVATLRVDLAIVTFGPVQLIQDFSAVDDIDPTTLFAEGMTPMGEAVTYAVHLLEDRKIAYKENGIQYYRPWLLLITDGSPTDSWKDAARQIKDAEESSKLSFFAIGVEGADMDILSELSVRPPLRLKGLEFSQVFVWLSQSVARVSSPSVGSMFELPPPNWGLLNDSSESEPSN